MPDNTLTNEDLDLYTADGEVEPVHPGVLYKRLVIDKKSPNISDMVIQVGVSRNMLYKIFNGESSITAKTAIGLAEVAENTPEFWLRAQMVYDLWKARKDRNTPQAAAY